MQQKTLYLEVIIEGNIKKNIKKLGCESIDWIQLAQDSGRLILWEGKIIV
jgi:hypothetical protein